VRLSCVGYIRWSQVRLAWVGLGYIGLGWFSEVKCEVRLDEVK
jgi:hypothetical protein